MKKVILLALLMPVMAFGQIVENFESGNLSNWIQSPENCWSADTSAKISGHYSLHHTFDNPDAGYDRIATPLTGLHPSQGVTRWTFHTRYGYDPSSSNNWSVFLLSDAPPSGMSNEGNTSGYAIGVNLAGYDDTLRLWKVKGNEITEVINCGINWQTEPCTDEAIKITVERSAAGVWFVSVFTSEDIPVTENTGTDIELFNPSWFGICYRYTSTRDRLLWFDDLSVEGCFFEDTIAPSVTRCEISGKNRVEITFSEAPDNKLRIPGNFSLGASGASPEYLVKKNDLTYIAEFDNMLINRSLNKLIINKLCDPAGNCTMDVEVPFTPSWAETGDVIISEIMADPVPQVALPAREYIEISNRTAYPIGLNKWKLSTDDQNFIFPETILRPGGIVIISLLTDTTLFNIYGDVVGLKQFPSLTDGGRLICLYDSSGCLIHGVDYSSEWYRDELKSDGGWSLEMIDSQYPFSGEENWRASGSRSGGTPGITNSVANSNPDIDFYGLENVFPGDSMNITVRFSEPVFDYVAMAERITIGDKCITGILPADPLLREFSVKLSDPLLVRELNEFKIGGEIKDFAGNPVQKRDFLFGLTESARTGEILFNELLFNPLPGDPDYIELYNPSEKIIDASQLQLISVNDESGDTSALYPVSDERRCILPGTYYAVTTDRERISGRYFSAVRECLFESRSIPSMSDDEGHLIVFNRQLDRIDEVYYDEAMHYSLLSQYEGISLEKTSPANKSEESINWHSAAESSGWGTPGARNSVFAEFPETSDMVLFSSAKITPDNDGNEDLLTIQFRLNGTGNIISVFIFDEAGSYVKRVAVNMLTAPEASIVWDGTADNGSLVNTGVYIVLIKLYDDTGKTRKWKKVCAVLR